jgi:hypothetical protein
MPAKKAKRSTKDVKSLKSHGLTAKQAKTVKGGIIIIGGRLKTPANPIMPKWNLSGRADEGPKE